MATPCSETEKSKFTRKIVNGVGSSHLSCSPNNHNRTTSDEESKAMTGFARATDIDIRKQTELQENSNQLLALNTEAINKFNKSSTRLAWAMIFVTVVSVIVTFVGLSKN